jgi:hypothetical protein
MRRRYEGLKPVAARLHWYSYKGIPTSHDRARRRAYGPQQTPRTSPVKRFTISLSGYSLVAGESSLAVSM